MRVKPMIAFSGVRKLVRHLRQEGALVTAGDRELASVVLDLAKQPCVLDRQRGLRRERLQQLDRAGIELARLPAVDDEPAEQATFPQQRHREERPIAQPHQQVADTTAVFALVAYVRDHDRIAGRRQPAKRTLVACDRRGAQSLHQLVRQPVGRMQPELLPPFVELVDRSAFRGRQVVGPRHDGRKHRLQVEGRTDRLTDLGQGLKLLDGTRQLRGPLLQLLEQPHVLDRYHRLVAKRLQQLDLLVRKGPRYGAADRDGADRCAVAEQRYRQHASETPARTFVKRVFGCLKDIMDGDRTALEDRPAGARPAVRGPRKDATDRINARRIDEMARRDVQQGPVEGEYIGRRGREEVQRRPGNGVEYRLDVVRRARDHAEDVTRHGLLLECVGKFAVASVEFLEQAHVFDRDHCLFGERCQ
jgi:hypothetical protein